MLPTRIARVAVVALAVLAVACGDPTTAEGHLRERAHRRTSLTALTGAPATAATAISFLGGAARADVRLRLRRRVRPRRRGAARHLPGARAGQRDSPAPAQARSACSSSPAPSTRCARRPKTGYDTLARADDPARRRARGRDARSQRAASYSSRRPVPLREAHGGQRAPPARGGSTRARSWTPTAATARSCRIRFPRSDARHQAGARAARRPARRHAAARRARRAGAPARPRAKRWSASAAC